MYLTCRYSCCQIPICHRRISDIRLDDLFRYSLPRFITIGNRTRVFLRYRCKDEIKFDARGEVGNDTPPFPHHVIFLSPLCAARRCAVPSPLCHWEPGLARPGPRRPTRARPEAPGPARDGPAWAPSHVEPVLALQRMGIAGVVSPVVAGFLLASPLHRRHALYHLNLRPFRETSNAVVICDLFVLFYLQEVTAVVIRSW